MTTRSTRPVTKCMIHFLGRPPPERCVQRIKSFSWMSALSQRDIIPLAFVIYLIPFLESSTIRMRVELFQMLQLILCCSFIPCIGLPLLMNICCTLLDLVRSITSLRNIFSRVAVEILNRSDCGCYCYVLL